MNTYVMPDFELLENGQLITETRCALSKRSFAVFFRGGAAHVGDAASAKKSSCKNWNALLGSEQDRTQLNGRVLEECCGCGCG